MRYQREHPIRILSRISHFAVLLVVPLLRALLYSGGSLRVWLSGGWIDLLVLVCMVGGGWLAWYFDLYAFNRDGVQKYTGLFRVRKAFYPLRQTTQIAVERPWYLRLFRAARLRLDTPAGVSSRSDLNLVLPARTALHFMETASGRGSGRHQMSSRRLSVFGLSLLSSNGLTGMVFIVTLLSQSGQIFGAEFERLVMDNLTSTARLIAFGIPPAAGVLSLLILTGWLTSFVFNLLRYAGFSARRSGDTLRIRSGVWASRRDYALSARLVTDIEIRQSLFTRILGMYTIYLQAVGYGKGKSELPVLQPTFRRREPLKTAAELLPELRFGPRSICVRKKDYRRLLLLPTLLLGGILLLTGAAALLFPRFTGLVLFCGSMLCAADMIYFAVKAIACRFTGIGRKEGVLTLCCTKGLHFYRICIREDRIVQAAIRQTVFQKRGGCCTLILYPFGEKRRRLTLANLPLEETTRLLFAGGQPGKHRAS